MRRPTNISARGGGRSGGGGGGGGKYLLALALICALGVAWFMFASVLLDPFHEQRDSHDTNGRVRTDALQRRGESDGGGGGGGGGGGNGGVAVGGSRDDAVRDLSAAAAQLYGDGNDGASDIDSLIEKHNANLAALRDATTESCPPCPKQAAAAAAAAGDAAAATTRAAPSDRSEFTCEGIHLEESTFCTKDRSDTERWWRRETGLRYKLLIGVHAHAHNNNNTIYARDATWYCDKHDPRFNAYSPEWRKPPRYDVKDIIIAVATGANVFHSRAAAVRDTWMMRFPHSYLYARHSEPNLPAIGLFSERTAYILAPNGRELNDVQSNQWIHLFALRDIYERHPEGKWFYLAGCDNHVNALKFQRIFDPLDASGKHWYAPYTWGQLPMPTTWDMSYWVNASGNPYTKDRKFTFTTGSTSWVLTNEVMPLYAAHIDQFIKQLVSTPADGVKNPKYVNIMGCGCHDVWAGFFLSLLGLTLELPTDWEFKFDGRAVDDWTADERASRRHEGFAVSHYVHPYRMYAADQRNIHEHVDRLAAGGQWKDMFDFFHSFIDERYEVLRRRQAEAIYLASPDGRMKVPRQREMDITYPVRPGMENMGDFWSMWRGDRNYAKYEWKDKPMTDDELLVVN